jgi:hypothetical protein
MVETLQAETQEGVKDGSVTRYSVNVVPVSFSSDLVLFEFYFIIPGPFLMVLVIFAHYKQLQSS